jgi:isopenicillin N synthase-like dioxygenase
MAFHTKVLRYDLLSNITTPVTGHDHHSLRHFLSCSVKENGIGMLRRGSCIIKGTALKAHYSSRAVNLATVDISPFLDSPSVAGGPLPRGEGRRKEVGDQVVQSLSKLGFMYIDNCIDERIINAAQSSAAAVFSSPAAVKHRLTTTDGLRGYYRYTHKGGEGDFIEAYNIGKDVRNPISLRLEYLKLLDYPQDLIDSSSWNQGNRYPAENSVDNFSREALTDYFNACSDVSAAVLRAIASGLGMDEQAVLSLHSKEDHNLEFKKYPPSAHLSLDHNGERLAAHTDLSTITILSQSSLGGLEVYDKSIPGWAEVPYQQKSLLVNIGDFGQTLFGLSSTLHRVVAKHQYHDSRSSIVFFCQPNREAILGVRGEGMAGDMFPFS